jgi:hypothetical protein
MAHNPALLLGALIAACGPLFFFVSKTISRRAGAVAVGD